MQCFCLARRNHSCVLFYVLVYYIMCLHIVKYSCLLRDARVDFTSFHRQRDSPTQTRPSIVKKQGGRQDFKNGGAFNSLKCNVNMKSSQAIYLQSSYVPMRSSSKALKLLISKILKLQRSRALKLESYQAPRLSRNQAIKLSSY